MDREKFPEISLMPVVDRVVNAALWVGKLLTKQIQHLTPSEHFTKPIERYDTFDLDQAIQEGWTHGES